jgi:hypothetical protein
MSSPFDDLTEHSSLAERFEILAKLRVIHKKERTWSTKLLLFFAPVFRPFILRYINNGCRELLSTLVYKKPVTISEAQIKIIYDMHDLYAASGFHFCAGIHFLLFLHYTFVPSLLLIFSSGQGMALGTFMIGMTAIPCFVGLFFLILAGLTYLVDDNATSFRAFLITTLLKVREWSGGIQRLRGQRLDEKLAQRVFASLESFFLGCSVLILVSLPFCGVLIPPQMVATLSYVAIVFSVVNMAETALFSNDCGCTVYHTQLEKDDNVYQSLGYARSGSFLDELKESLYASYVASEIPRENLKKGQEDAVFSWVYIRDGVVRNKSTVEKVSGVSK